MRDQRWWLGRLRRAGTCVLGSLVLTTAPLARAQPVLAPTFTEFHHPALGGGSPAIVVGPDGALWFPAGDMIVRLTTSGVMTDHPLPPDGQTYPNGRGIGDITVGPDGALWFTESAPGRIGRITTDGVITELSLAPGRQPQHITLGPDGALWYTEFADRVGRITTDGAVTEYAMPPCGPTCRPHPADIVAGPDGALWFTNLGDNRLWRITTSGQLTAFDRFIVQVGALMVGPDDALWFTAADTAGPDDHIGRMTTAGVMSAFPLPLYPRPTYNGDNNLAPGALTTGPDDALWFTSSRVNVIGRMTWNGQVTLHELPDAPGTDDLWVSRAIVTGPDHALWITNRGRIVRAALTGMPGRVTLDIKPGSCRNPFSRASHGVLPAAVLAGDDVDIRAIAPETLRLNGVPALRWRTVDVGGVGAGCAGQGLDGTPDLLLRFSSQAIAATLPATTAGPVPLTLTGRLKPEYGGTAIDGMDTITVVGKR